MQNTEEEVRYRRKWVIGWATIILAIIPFVVAMLKLAYFIAQLNFPTDRWPTTIAQGMYKWRYFPRPVWDLVPPHHADLTNLSNLWILALFGAILWGGYTTRRAGECLAEYKALRREEVREARRRKVRQM